jgi:hypothetical protein
LFTIFFMGFAGWNLALMSLRWLTAYDCTHIMELLECASCGLRGHAHIWLCS